MEKISKIHHEAFDGNDDSQLKEFALDCLDRVLHQNEDSLAIQNKNHEKPYFLLHSQKVNYY